MFQHDERLGIQVPALKREWHDYSMDEKQEMMHRWEMIRGQIPDRIQELEKTINRKQFELDREEDFEQSCRLNTEISELASIINDLWLWFRTVPDVNSTTKLHS